MDYFSNAPESGLLGPIRVGQHTVHEKWMMNYIASDMKCSFLSPFASLNLAFACANFMYTNSEVNTSETSAHGFQSYRYVSCGVLYFKIRKYGYHC